MIPMEHKLLDLFARLSRSSARNRLYAMRARKDNRPQLAQLFLALAVTHEPPDNCPIYTAPKNRCKMVATG